MRKIINGKAYDTGTAHEVGDWQNLDDVRSFDWTHEVLYRKRTGEYFIHGEGGPLTRYAEASGQNQWTGGSRIMPMSYGDAVKWAEEHLDADVYEAEFGEVGEGDEKVRLNLRVPQSTADKLRRAAVQRGISLGGLIEHVAEGL